MGNDVTGLKEFENMFLNVPKGVQYDIEKNIKLCCEKVRGDIVLSMAQTPRDTSRSYKRGKKEHNPSMPNNPPAPDTGNLRRSIKYEVKGSGTEVYGVVGSTQKEPDYATWTEYGTSKMAPRPWLRPNMLKNETWIRNILKETVASKMKEKNL